MAAAMLHYDHDQSALNKHIKIKKESVWFGKIWQGQLLQHYQQLSALWVFYEIAYSVEKEQDLNRSRSVQVLVAFNVWP